MSEMAVRHPKRGKAHRLKVGVVRLLPYGAQCGMTACDREDKRMTEVIPVEQTNEADRCKRCWPTT